MCWYPCLTLRRCSSPHALLVLSALSAAPAVTAPPLNDSCRVLPSPVCRLVELGSLTEAQELLKFMLVARETDSPAAPPSGGAAAAAAQQGKMLDCYGAHACRNRRYP